MSTDQSAPSPSVARPTLGRVTRTGAVAAVVAAGVVAVAASVIVQLFGIDPAFQPLTPPAAASVTMLYVGLGTAILAVVCRVAANPRQAFIRVAILGLALSFIPQIALMVSGFEVPMGEFTPSNVLALSSLHLVAAAVALPILLRVFRP